MAKAAKKSVKVTKRSVTGSTKTAKRPAARPSSRPPERSAPPVQRSHAPIPRDILKYNAAQSAGDKRICEMLATLIDRHLPGARGKIWHAHPVWFLEGNPIVGYHKLKDCVRLLFWSGRSFDEPALAPEGGFQSAGARYTSDDQISASDLKRWLAKSIEIQWDYKNIVKRRGRLERLK